LPISGNYPEFIEFYNKGDVQLDITDWVIKNEDTTIIINSDILYGDAISTIIEFGKWLVIDLSKVGEDILDNTSDIITLYDSENNEIDTISYVEASMADKSYARIPDGSSSWVDPIPTPGAPNKLDEEELDEEEVEKLEPEPEPEIIQELQLEEVIEEIPLITTTTTTSTIPDSDILENSTSTNTTVPEEITTITTEPLVAGAATSTTTVPTPVNENQEEPNSDEDNTFLEETTEEQPFPEEMVVVETTVEELTNEEQTIIDEQAIVDEQTVVENQPAIEEQPVVVPDNNPSNLDGAGESVSDDSASPVEGTGENSGDSGVDAGSESVSE